MSDKSRYVQPSTPARYTQDGWERLPVVAADAPPLIPLRWYAVTFIFLLILALVVHAFGG